MNDTGNDLSMDVEDEDTFEEEQRDTDESLGGGSDPPKSVSIQDSVSQARLEKRRPSCH